MDRKTKAHNAMAKKILCEERKRDGIWARPADYPDKHAFGTVDIIVPGSPPQGRQMR